jgi:hypothetical protein
MLKIDSAASSGDQGKLTLMYFSFPPLEAVLSTSTLCFLFTLARKLLFLLDVLGSYCFLLHVLGSYCFVFTCARKL